MGEEVVVDRLVWLLKCFSLEAKVFQAGTLTDPANFSAEDGLSYIHILRSGSSKNALC